MVLLAGSIGSGQLTTEQKLADFRHLAGLYAKQYAPYEWKFAVERFDLLKLNGWIECVARLDDAHDAYTLPSTFLATTTSGIPAGAEMCYLGRKHRG